MKLKSLLARGTPTFGFRMLQERQYSIIFSKWYVAWMADIWKNSTVKNKSEFNTDV